jgi:NADPH-dependent curcumin reductase
MLQNATVNRRIVLASGPSGAPITEHFRTELGDVPKPDAGPVLLRTLDSLLDPCMRGRVSSGPSCAAPAGLGEVMVGGRVSRVKASNHSSFKVGKLLIQRAHE